MNGLILPRAVDGDKGVLHCRCGEGGGGIVAWHFRVSALLQNAVSLRGENRYPLDWGPDGPQIQYGHALYQLSYPGFSIEFGISLYIYLSSAFQFLRLSIFGTFIFVRTQNVVMMMPVNEPDTDSSYESRHSPRCWKE